jgi:hypothetical protein
MPTYRTLEVEQFLQLCTLLLLIHGVFHLNPNCLEEQTFPFFYDLRGSGLIKQRSLLHCRDSYFENFTKLSIHTIKNQAFDLFIMQSDKFTEEDNLKFTRLDNKDIIR